ncbi:hypothetical protein FH5_00228 [Priestia endophytica]|nr:hypothetical protein FH5_00228 [Priestia endophytica]
MVSAHWVATLAKLYKKGEMIYRIKNLSYSSVKRKNLG